ncbi:MAG: peptidylprolyl isomerase [Gammaproteobacteria bacterium]|nr:peptidylprolyl isomerase [Gammaproteobacteria bacterium]MDH5515310.1 peptidylprolyl isomerase [Gammaproteobacteria bacterium]
MNLRNVLLAGALLSLAGCDQMQTTLNTTDSGSTPAAAVTGDIIATVNGSPITRQVLDVYKQQRAAKGIQPDTSDDDAVLNELVALELMRQEAANSGARADPVISATLDQLDRSTLAGAAIKSFITANESSDEELRNAYDTGVGKPGNEFNARHILVDSEQEAKDIIALLDAGGDFAELAREKSTGPSGPNGGELGWFGAGQMVKPFADATATLEKGSYTKEPVQTQFGWHVIRLEDTREGTPPPFEDVKERLKIMLANQKLQKHIEEMKASAKIDIK